MTSSTVDESKAERTAWASTAVDKLPTLVAYWDKDQRCKFANAACREGVGARPDGVADISLKELLGPLYLLNLPCIEKALQGQEQALEHEVPDAAHGPPRYSEAHYVPHVVDGEVQGFCLFIADITRCKRAEQALESMQRHCAAREELARLATLAVGIAHEARNPLATIFGNLELALDAVEQGLIDRAALRSMLRDAREAAGRLREIVQSMNLLVDRRDASHLGCHRKEDRNGSGSRRLRDPIRADREDRAPHGEDPR